MILSQNNMDKTKCFLTIFALAAVAVFAAFAAVVLSGILREFTHFGLEGRRFSMFYGSFLPLLTAVQSITFFLGRKSVRSIWLFGVVGAGTGFLSGFVALLLWDTARVFAGKASLHMLVSLSSMPERLFFPLVSLNWLVGLISGVFLCLMLRYFSAGSELRGAPRSSASYGR